MFFFFSKMAYKYREHNLWYLFLPCHYNICRNHCEIFSYFWRRTLEEYLRYHLNRLSLLVETECRHCLKETEYTRHIFNWLQLILWITLSSQGPLIKHFTSCVRAIKNCIFVPTGKSDCTDKKPWSFAILECIFANALKYTLL